jgi:hypothetical protein
VGILKNVMPVDITDVGITFFEMLINIFTFFPCMIPGGITGIFLNTAVAFTLCKALGDRLYRNWACF